MRQVLTISLLQLQSVTAMRYKNNRV